MSSTPINPAAYTDLARLASLKKDSSGQESLKQVAQEFEALLVGQMLKAMRSATNVLTEGSYLQSNETQLYQEMLDQQLAVTLSRQKGLGLSEVLIRQLSPSLAPALATASSQESVQREQSTLRSKAQATIEQAQAKWQASAGDRGTFASPAEFIQRLKPLAESSAAPMGLQPLWLLAQAALEISLALKPTAGTDLRLAWRPPNTKTAKLSSKPLVFALIPLLRTALPITWVFYKVIRAIGKRCSALIIQNNLSAH